MFNYGRRRNGSASGWHPRNGSTTIESIPEVPGEESESHGTTRNLTTASSSRPTFPWPFQSHSVNQSIAESSANHSRSVSYPRRKSWMALRPASSVLGSDIIPDYVVNYLRGETPESLARRREMEGNPHNPDFHHHKRNEHSRIADFYSSHSRLGSMDVEALLAGSKAGFLRKWVMGWRGGVALNMLLAFLILIAVIICLVLAVTTDRISAQQTTAVTGQCSRISTIDQGIHGLVNVLGFFFVAGANYVAQVLVSPTRAELTAVHDKQSWLDIGIPSLRNLGGISLWRAILSAVVLFVAMSAQVILNAVVYTTQPTIDFDGTESCTLALNGPVLGAVAILNLLFILLLAVAVVRPASDSPLVTLGDAIASFLSESDPATEGACLLNKADVVAGNWGRGEAKYWFTESHRWVSTPSRIQWLVWFVTWLLPVGMAAASLSTSMLDKSAGAFTSLGEPTSTYNIPGNAPTIGLAIVVAMPQLLLSILYLSTNALLTVFYLSHEFSQFSVPDRLAPLRVSSSNPAGYQTTSLYLTLPRPLSWALFIAFFGMAFMLSQAFSLVAVGNPGDDSSSSALGLNPLPLTVMLGLLAVVAILVASLSLRRADLASIEEEGRRAGNPLSLKGGSCSAVISARCHRAVRDGHDVAIRPLAFGVVENNEAVKVGHATFSSQPVEALRVGKAYV